MKGQWGCQGPGWVFMFMCEHVCSGCGLQAASGWRFFLLGEYRASSVLIQAWCVELWSFPEPWGMHLPGLSKDLSGCLVLGSWDVQPHGWGDNGCLCSAFLQCAGCPVLCDTRGILNHARGGLGFMDYCACGEDMTGLPRVAGAGVWDLFGFWDPRALCEPFLGPWSLCLCPAWCRGGC